MSIETTVKDILAKKEIKEVKTIRPDESVFDALKQMALHNVGALVVMEAGRIVGVISERDYARKVVLRDRSSRTTKVSEIMERKVLYVVPQDSAEGCMALMTTKRIRHLPVFEKDKLIGLVSIGDIVKAVIVDHEFMIDQLICYTTGSHSGRFDNPAFSSKPMAEERVLS